MSSEIIYEYDPIADKWTSRGKLREETSNNFYGFSLATNILLVAINTTHGQPSYLNRLHPTCWNTKEEGEVLRTFL